MEHVGSHQVPVETRPNQLPKSPTGISGLDAITGGGLPKGRPTLVCGPAGSGKTLLAMEFLFRGIAEFGEAGVFVSFEESDRDLTANVASLGFDLPRFTAAGSLIVDQVNVGGESMHEIGDWDLDGLLLRLGASIDAIGARRVVIDTIENLFGVFSNTAVLRSELRRLFGWLKSREVTAVITGERGDGTLTRYGIEEYVSDCVIVLDHRVTEQTSTRRLRILKYRGSLHGTNEYPFLIGESGLSVLPITTLVPRRDVSDARISTGIVRLDAMLGDGGYYRGSTILISGTAGTGKSTLAAQFCYAACGRGERALYFAFEESEAEIVRNMRSVGIELQQWIDAGLLEYRCARPTLLGLEGHLTAMQNAVTEFEPAVVVLDPTSDLSAIGSRPDVSALLTRQVDFLKSRGVTALFTSLASDERATESDQQLTSLVDTLVRVQMTEGHGEHNRLLYIMKSRGMAHSNQIREFLLTDQGIELADVYVGARGVLTGSARQAQEAQEDGEESTRRDALEQQKVGLDRRRELVVEQTTGLWRAFEEEVDAFDRLVSGGATEARVRVGQRDEQARLRKADAVSAVDPTSEHHR